MEASESSPLISTYGTLNIDESQRDSDPEESSRSSISMSRILSVFIFGLTLFLVITSRKKLNTTLNQSSVNERQSFDQAYLGAYSSNKWIATNSNIRDDHEVTFFVGLKTKDDDELLNTLQRVSDPSHEEYGKYLSLDEMSNKFGAPIHHQLIAFDYFQQIPDAVVQLNLQGDMLRISAKTEHIQNTLNTQLSIHSHVEFPHLKSIRASSSLDIPSHISDIISFISLNSPILHPSIATEKIKLFQSNNGNNNLRDEPFQTSETDADLAVGTTTPYVWYNLYKIPFAKTSGKGSQAFVSFFGEMFSNSDLLKFLKKADVQYPSFSSMFPTSGKIIPAERIYGNLKNYESTPSAEATLDSQVLVATAPNITTYEYNMNALNPYNAANEGFLEYLWIVGNQTDPPLVHSISYGDDEANIFATTGSAAYARAVDAQFIKAAERGLSIIFASGDSGVAGLASSSVKCSQTWPVWPASSPYVTSVGGTMLSNGVEAVCDRTIVSGGGFSNIYTRSDQTTWWQNTVVSAYVSSGNSASSGYKSTGRGYPDVSTLADDFMTTRSSYTSSISGTSASAPLFAGIIARLNDQRLASGLSPLGFLNPFLYASKSAFNDITSGNNKAGCSTGFSAGSGWDAVSGLGTPNYASLQTAALTYGANSNVKPSSTTNPSSKPSVSPTPRPSTLRPTSKPSAGPSPKPSVKPSNKPTAGPTTKPTAKPSPIPTLKPTSISTSKPTSKPSVKPTKKS